MMPARFRLPPRRIARGLGSVLLLSLLVLSAAGAQERQRSASERDAGRQTVQPGQAPSSRRQPSRVGNADEPAPTVQNRAPEVVGPRPVPMPTPTPTPTPIPSNGGG